MSIGTIQAINVVPSTVSTMSFRGGNKPYKPVGTGYDDHRHISRGAGGFPLYSQSDDRSPTSMLRPSIAGGGGTNVSMASVAPTIGATGMVHDRTPPPPIGTPSFQNQGTFRYILGIDETTPEVPESPYQGSFHSGLPARTLGPVGQKPGNQAIQATQDWPPVDQRASVGLWDQEYPSLSSVAEAARHAQLGIGNPPNRNQPPRRSINKDDLERPPQANVSQRRPANRDEFDGPHQLLDRPSAEIIAAQERDLPHLPTNLFVQEQDDVLAQVNSRLSNCAFDFIAKYQFPIPLEPDKRPVAVPGDREWTEWVYLLKRLATKRRIPARVLYNNQIKQLVTVLENSLEMRHAAKHQSRPLKDDRNVLQLISAGIQVAKMLKDGGAMEFLDRLYISTEQLIQSRKSLSRFPI